MADGKGRYILYFADERLYYCPQPVTKRSLTVTLKLPPGRYVAQTFDPKSGRIAALANVQSDGQARLKIPAFDEDLAVLLQSDSTTAGRGPAAADEPMIREIERRR